MLRAPASSTAATTERPTERPLSGSAALAQQQQQQRNPLRLTSQGQGGINELGSRAKKGRGREGRVIPFG